MSPEMTIALSFLIPLAGALLILAASRVNDNLREGVTLVTAIALAITIWSLIPELMAGGRP
ncbi:MAG: multicomponent Na+:H+ antiporter subunit D, partial [Candidatus Azotimanducaceae bacterium]